MKKLFFLVIILIHLSSFSFSQDNTNLTSAVSKPSSPTLSNDIYGGYGGFSIFYFVGNISPSFNSFYSYDLNNAQSIGTFSLGYARALNPVVNMGFLFGYQNLQRKGTANAGYSDVGVPVTVNDNLIMGMARVTFNYLHKPVIHMYSGVGIGITINLATSKGTGISESERKLIPGGQLTLMGIRFGRAFGGFVEFGFGTYGIINAGLSYKFAD